MTRVPGWLAGSATVEALTSAGSEVADAKETLRAAEAARRRAVVTALGEGMPPTQVAHLSGLSRQGVYAIQKRPDV